MKTVLKATSPYDIDFTMSVTMPLGDWRKLATQLSSNAYPSWMLGKEIRLLVEKATAEFTAEEGSAQ